MANILHHDINIITTKKKNQQENKTVYVCRGEGYVNDPDAGEGTLAHRGGNVTCTVTYDGTKTCKQIETTIIKKLKKNGNVV